MKLVVKQSDAKKASGLVSGRSKGTNCIKKAPLKKATVQVTDRDLGIPHRRFLESLHPDEEGCMANRDFENVMGITRKEQKIIAKDEHDILLWAEHGGPALNVSDWLDEGGFEETTRIPPYLQGIDPGLMATVAALSVLGCCPVTSCVGGPGHSELHPLVVFWCKKSAWPRVRKAAISTGVSLKGAQVEGHRGIVAYHKQEWRALHAFGQALMEGP